jgi:DNA-binding transcriptional MerR regulator
MEHLIPIGQFAALTRLSTKALRLYDENGLLPPARVDPDTGYRYYRLNQVADARLIRLLRAADMPLSEIAAFLGDRRAEQLDAFGARLAARQAERERVLRYLRRTIGEGDDVAYEVRIKETAAQPYASRSATVSIGELGSFITSAIDELTAAVEPVGAPFAIFHGEVNDETDGRVEVGMPTAERPADGSELPAGLVAFTVVEGEQATYPEILSAYDAVADWAKRHGHELVCPPREVYLSGPGEPERMEIAWPIR